MIVSDEVVEPVDVNGDGVFGLWAGLPCDRPLQLRLVGLEEGLDGGVIVGVQSRHLVDRVENELIRL